MRHPKTMYDVNRLSLEELRAWLLSQNISLPPVHRNQQSLHGLREIALKHLAEVKEEKRRIVQRNHQSIQRMRERAAATRQAAKIMFSQEPDSSKSTGCIPLENIREEIHSTTTSALMPSTESLNIVQSEPKEFSTFPTESSSMHKIPKPWAMSYDIMSGKPIAEIISSSSSASLGKSNCHTSNLSALDPEINIPSPPPQIHAISPMETKTVILKENKERFSRKKCIRTTPPGLQQKPLLLGEKKAYTMHAELLSSRSAGDATGDSSIGVLTSATRICHPWEFHESASSQVVDEHLHGRHEFSNLNRNLSSVQMSSSPHKSGSAKGVATCDRVRHLLQWPRRVTSSQSASNRLSSPASSTSSSSSSPSPSPSINCSNTASNIFSPMLWKPQTWALLACIAATLSLLLLSKYKDHVEEYERQRYWWT